MKTQLILSNKLFLWFLIGVISMDLSITKAQSPWTQIADMPVAKHGFSACFLDGKLYVMGGIDHYSDEVGEFALRNLHVYDPDLDSWTEKSNMHVGRFNFSSCAYDGKILAIGGSTDIYWTPVSAIDAYDPLSGEWSTITHIPEPGVWQAADLLNDKIYVFGGAATESGTPYVKVQVYDLLTNTWSEGAEMLTPRIGLEAVALDGKIYVLGGQDNSAGYVGMNTLEVYEPETNTWGQKAGMIVPRKNSQSCELNGKIYVLGGMSGGIDGFEEGGEFYDPITDSWKELRDSPRVLGFCAGSPMNGKVYIGGGHEGSSSGLIEYKSWFIYDPQHEENVSIPDIPFPEKELSIYPNPTINKLTIETKISTQYYIEIINLNGQLIYIGEMEGTTHQIDLFSVQKGVYFITIRSKDFVTTRKIIKL